MSTSNIISKQYYQVHFRHAAYYLSVLQNVRSTSDSQDLGTFEQEWENIKLGQAWAAETFSEDENAAQLCLDYATAGLSWLILNRWSSREVINWCETGLEASKRLNSRPMCGLAQLTLGRAYVLAGEEQRAIAYFEQALALARADGARDVEVMVLLHLARACSNRLLLERAVAYYEEVIELAGQAQNKEIEVEALIGQGDAYTEYGDKIRARKAHDAALAAFREIQDHSLSSEVGERLATLHFSLGNYPAAIECLEKLLPLAKNMAHRETRILNLLSLSYLGQGHFERALDIYNQLLAYYSDQRSPVMTAAVLKEIAEVYQNNGDLEKALALYQRALGLLEKRDAKHLPAEILWRMAEVFGHLNEWTKSIDCSQRALRMVDENSRLSDKIKRQLALSYAETGERSLALTLIDDELKRARVNHDALREANALLSAAVVCGMGGNHQRASSLAEECLNKSKPYGAVELEGEALNVLFSAHFKLEDWVSSQRAGHRLLALTKSAMPLLTRQRIWRQLWSSYLKTNDYDGALNCAQERLELARLNQNKLNEGEALIESAGVSLCCGDRKGAQQLFAEGFSLVTQNGSPADVVRAHYLVAEAYKAGGDLEEALSVCEKAAAIVHENGAEHLLVELWEMREGIFAQLDDIKRRVDFYKSYLTFAVQGGFPRQAVRAHHGLGICFHLMNDYSEAVSHYRQCAALAHDLGEQGWEHTSVANLARNLERWALYQSVTEPEAHKLLELAAEQYKKQLGLAIELEDQEGKLTALQGLGNAYGNLRDFSRAAAYFEEGLALARATQHSSASITLDMLAAVYLEAGQKEKAVALYAAQMSDSKASGDELAILTCLIGQATFYTRAGETQRALEFYDKAISLAKKRGSDALEATALYGKAQVLAYELQSYGEAIPPGLASLKLFRKIGGSPPNLLEDLDAEIEQWQQHVL